jgi:hypothetical protein
MSVSPASPRTRGQGSNSQRPRATTVFAAAFLAGAAAAVCVNRALDLHIAQTRPRVESESIFVALRSLPQGSPVTVWDVGLRDWPKAMLPTAAMRPNDTFDGMVLKYPLREGQPVLSVQLVKAASDPAPSATATAQSQPPLEAVQQPDLWTPTAAVEPTLVIPSQAPSDPIPTVAAPIVVAATPVATDPVSTDVEPTPVTVLQQPTLAATDAELDAAADLAASGSSASSEFPPQQQTLPTASPPVIRYLVVPERIALQADRSFLPAPPPPAPSAAEPAAATPPPAAQPKNPLPPTQPVERQPRHGGQSTTRAARADGSGSRATAPVPLPEATMKAVSAEPAEPYKPSMFRSMFPNLSAGVAAVEDQLEWSKRERSATQQPRSAVRPSAPRQ